MGLKDDRGSSTAELAVLLPGIALMLSLTLGVGVLGMQQIRVQQAASAVARELARGEEPAQARATGSRLAGGKARFSISTGGSLAEVKVSRILQVPLIGTVTLRGEAHASWEQK